MEAQPIAQAEVIKPIQKPPTINTSNSEVHQNPNKPQIIEKTDLKILAKKQFESKIGKQFTQEELYAFIDSNVTGMRMNGANLIMVNEDYHRTMGKLNPVSQAFIESSQTKTVQVEYFSPEIRKNASRNPISRKLLNMFYNDTVRGDFADKLIACCKENNKLIAAADISEKMALFKTLEDYDEFSLLVASTFIPFAKFVAYPYLINKFAEKILHIFHKGHFDPQKHHRQAERFLVSLEDARNIFAAAGAEELTKEYGNEGTSIEESPQVLLFYPKAHTMRIENYILHKPYPKGFFYRLYRFLGLNFSLRQFTSENQIDQANSMEGWTMFSNKQLTVSGVTKK